MDKPIALVWVRPLFIGDIEQKCRSNHPTTGSHCIEQEHESNGDARFDEHHEIAAQAHIWRSVAEFLKAALILRMSYP